MRPRSRLKAWLVREVENSETRLQVLSPKHSNQRMQMFCSGQKLCRWFDWGKEKAVVPFGSLSAYDVVARRKHARLLGTIS